MASMSSSESSPLPEFNDAAIRAPVGGDDVVVRLAPGEWHRAAEVLREDGCVVFEGVASPADIQEAKQLFWSWIRKTQTGIDPSDPKTMCDANWKQLGYHASGVIASLGIGQSDLLWHLRQLPNVQQIFRHAWQLEETEGLITSYDGVGAFRNPFLPKKLRLEEDWYTKIGWYHTDQNYNLTPRQDCIQGVLNLIDVTPAGCGSTVVVPRSHHRFPELFEHPERKKSKGKLVHVNKPGDFDRFLRGAVQVPLRAGDFLMWDSRVIHCNQGIDRTAPISQVLPGREDDLLARFVAYICMLPRSRLDRHPEADKVRQARRTFVERGFTGPHHPIELPTGGLRVDSLPNYKPPKREDTRWRLV